MTTTTRSKHKSAEEGKWKPKQVVSKKKEDKDEVEEPRTGADSSASTAKQENLLTPAQKSQIIIDIEKHPGILWKALLKQFPVYYKLVSPTK
ncbi:hypothetical protein SEMRO_3844_G351440.1 [Seminavis robusta]|uniref:Uncharacterized protein n=1 Tax=Seminavis robusta TaxID=568900 RepID=A0A9N8HZN6_9STRA|nr:hypothetical protein SEMRO_3844_G351440.1 [Seminavis robusta]|eukprot:Sro3844_g351440.1 n/a (92) ;mRNA; r:2569-2844